MEQLKNKYLLLAVPYFLIIGTSYLWGYWGTFDLNVFEFSSFDEIIMASLMPLMSVAATFGVGLALGFFHRNSTNNDSRTTPKQSMDFIDWIIFLVYFLPSVIMFVITDNQSFRWTMGIFFLSILVVYLAVRFIPLLDIFETKLQVIAFLFMLVFVFMSFGAGKKNAFRIIDNVEYKFFLYNNVKFKFIGNVNNKNFFIDVKNENLLILHEDETKSLILTKHKDNSITIFN